MGFQFFTVPGEPQNVRARPVNSSSVEVSWDPPVDNDKNGVIRGYQIFVQPKNVRVIRVFGYNKITGLL